MLRRALVLVLGWLLIAGTAQAATISTQIYGDPKLGDTAEIHFVANPGETNDVFAVVTAGGWIVRDNGAPLSAGAQCTAIDSNSARCTAPASTISLALDLGDGNDKAVTPDNQYVTIVGGAGNDSITGDGTFVGGAGDDILTGGPASDNLYGGTGSDSLIGYGGDDTLAGDADSVDGPDLGGYDDIVVGGNGNDTLLYTGRPTAITVDLTTRAMTGARGERETPYSVENITGGNGDDVLLGDEANNTLRGGGGNDRLSGRGGDDTLAGDGGIDIADGGDGNDHLFGGDIGERLSGGAGDDLISAAGRGLYLDGGSGDDFMASQGSPLSLVCGAGDDTVASQGLDGTHRDDCEHAAFGVNRIAITPRRTSRLIGIPITCDIPRRTIVKQCSGTIEVALRRAGAQNLGHVSYRLAGGAHATVHLHLTARGRFALRGVAHPTLLLTVTAKDTYAEKRTGSWRVTI